MKKVYESISKINDRKINLSFDIANTISKRANIKIQNVVTGIVNNKILITKNKPDFVEFIFNETFIGKGLVPKNSQYWQRAVFLELVALQYSNVTFVIKDGEDKIYVYLTGLGDEHYEKNDI